ncbi:hypothetical protein JJQ59_15250 [Cupriavidus necator]|uniref:Uncharacterized protein n=1 Tax=Cupriavidus necator TaxID=106590 RepID=A0A367PHE2_CUPNE|nr:hypothetical protein [Cupriavidus necator]QQX83757.1 hypothetical protein JJQ59_15250 [Cupriavidus necator]RCJ07288.1 hypothetical protein DDK22_16525 [Cupriavidus necator]
MAREKRLTPRQRREARELAGAEAAAEKRARLLQRPLEHGSPRIENAPAGGKSARIEEDPGSIYGVRMQWCPLRSDVDGKWSWGQDRQWSAQDWENIILPALEALQALTWGEIVAQRTGGNNRHKKHHDMDVGVIDDEALERWIARGLEEYDTAFRFRLGNMPRLWGFRTAAKFNIVWWDPAHRIYPVDIADN